MAVGGFAGCSDEENKDNGEGTKEPTENVDTKEKRVMTIRGEYYDEHGKMWDSYTLGFRYDAQGRVDTIITNGTRKEVLTYEENRVTGTSAGFVRECTFENGLVAKERCEGIERRRTSEYFYADGRLSSMKITGLLNQTENDVMTMEVMTDGSGNWVGVNSTYPVESEDHADAQNIYTITMSNVENNLNLDLMGLFFGGENEIGLLLGFAGERSPKLIAEMLSKETLESSEEVYTDLYTFSYQVDEDGYLREIRAELREEGELSDVTIYKIGYEEGDVSIVTPGEDGEEGDDGEDEGEGEEDGSNEPINPTEGIVVLERKVMAIQEKHFDEAGKLLKTCDFSFSYDDQNRVIRYDETGNWWTGDAFSSDLGVTYNEEEENVTVLYNGIEAYYELKNGCVRNSTYEEIEYTYEYSESGYLSMAEWREGSDYSRQYLTTTDDGWHNGTWEEFYAGDDDGVRTGEIGLTMSTVENNASLNLCGWLLQYTDIMLDCDEMWLDLTGRRSRWLPEEVMVSPYPDGGYDRWKYEYTVDSDGYVTKIVERQDGIETGRTEYVITYEE